MSVLLPLLCVTPLIDAGSGKHSARIVIVAHGEHRRCEYRKESPIFYNWISNSKVLSTVKKRLTNSGYPLL